MKKKYIAPGLTVVTFRMERGYAASLPEQLNQQVDLMLMMESNEERSYHNNIYDFETHPDWTDGNDESFWL